jgi:chromosome segregation ATPase
MNEDLHSAHQHAIQGWIGSRSTENHSGGVDAATSSDYNSIHFDEDASSDATLKFALMTRLAQVREVHAAECLKLRKDIAAKDELLEKTKLEKDHLENRAGFWEERLNSLHAENISLREQIAEAAHKDEVLHDEVAATQVMLDVIRRELTAKTSDLETVSDQMAHMNDRLISLENHTQNLEQELEKKDQVAAKACEEADRLRTKNQKLQEDKSRLVKEVSDRDALIGLLNIDINAKTQELEKSCTLMRGKNERIATLDGHKQLLLHEITDARQQIQRLVAELEKFRAPNRAPPQEQHKPLKELSWHSLSRTSIATLETQKTEMEDQSLCSYEYDKADASQANVTDFSGGITEVSERVDGIRLRSVECGLSSERLARDDTFPMQNGTIVFFRDDESGCRSGASDTIDSCSSESQLEQKERMSPKNQKAEEPSRVQSAEMRLAEIQAQCESLRLVLENLNAKRRSIKKRLKRMATSDDDSTQSIRELLHQSRVLKKDVKRLVKRIAGLQVSVRRCSI